MTIKEVEKNTGLSAKTIRYYEDEGLIHVVRDKDNSYRNYSEDDVMLLKKIKLFRYINFSVADIKEISNMEDEKISELLLDKVEEFQEKNEENDMKKDLCIQISKDLKKEKMNVEKYVDIVHFYEDEEIQTILKDIEVLSSFELIAIFLICLGPIISLFINIEREMWDILVINSILAIISTIVLTINCRNYICWYKSKRKIIKKKNNEVRKSVPAFIISIIIFIFSLILVNIIIEKTLAPNGWLFYEFQFPAFLIDILTFSELFYFSEVVRRILNKEKVNVKLCIIYLLILIAGSYMCLTNTVFVTDSSIVYYSPLNLSGNVYSYSDVTKVETKFGDKIFSLNEYYKKGYFQYAIYFDDKKIVFSIPSVNSNIEKYEEDTYLELEEFDNKLMNLNITKISSDVNSEYCDLDEYYCDRFLKIIRNE